MTRDGTPHPPPPTSGAISRRTLLAIGGGAAALGLGYGLLPGFRERFRKALASGPYTHREFSEAEIVTLAALADMIIPADDHSGSASDAGTIPYIDFVISEANDDTRSAWHDGLTWLDTTCRDRFDASFADCTPEQRGEVMDSVAWPDRVTDALRDHSEWFTRVRDLVGSGFFSSQIGVRDLGYQGGVGNPNWTSAPPEALEELGVSYDEWDARYGGQA